MAVATFRMLLVALALAYPLLAHAAVAGGDDRLLALASAVLVVLVVAPSRYSASRAVRVGLPLAGLAVLVLLERASAHVVLLYLPPVLLNAYMAWVFGHTLAPGRVPLIERLARIIHGDTTLDPRIPAYARALTRTWTVLFVVLATVNLVLALCATPDGLLERVGIAPPVAIPRAWWSLFANLLNYLLVALLFACEYALRKRLFPSRPYRDMREFLMRMKAAGPRLWAELRQDLRP